MDEQSADSTGVSRARWQALLWAVIAVDAEGIHALLADLDPTVAAIALDVTRAQAELYLYEKGDRLTASATISCWLRRHRLDP